MVGAPPAPWGPPAPPARIGRAALVAVGLLLGAGALCGFTARAQGAVSIGPTEIVVPAHQGARAIIARNPFGLAFADSSGRRVLNEVPATPTPLPVPPLAQAQFGTIGPPGPALYAPLGFLVGTQSTSQTQAGEWEGNLNAVTETGAAYSAQAVLDATPVGDGVRLTLATNDPSGRRLALLVSPTGSGNGLRVSATPTPDTGVATMSDSFSSTPQEAFRGFGGRHNSLDQQGSEFYNFLQQENVGSGSAQGLTAPAAPGQDRYLFPNGPYAAYYVQSSFVSSAGYGFLLDRAEISHWRLDSDRPDAWQTEVAAPAIDYVVAPGDGASAIGQLTQMTGRQPAPPDWAVGSILDRLVKFPSDPPAQYQAEVQDDIDNMDRYHLYPAAYRIEAWQFLARPVLAHLISELKSRGIHPLLYFRAFVGQDTTGTDTPSAYDDALAKGLVATHSDGSPYTFISNFNANAAQIDFTNPAAVTWWQGRVREALDLGADGFMQDFGEQVLTDMHFHDGSTGATMHNLLPVLYHRATRDVVGAFERAHPGRRIFFYTRAGYTGTPGSAAYEGGNFPGDETTDWSRASGLASQTPDMLNRTIGGALGYTTDIGGYFDVGPYTATTKELFLRWAEWAALSPLFRLHGSAAAGTHTPWSYDADTVRIYKALTQLHLQARQLILNLWRQGQRTGLPITRPLWLAYPGDPQAAQQDQEWLLGPDVLVAPVVTQGATARTVYLPAGCWQEPDTGARYRGPSSPTVDAPIERLPYFFRCATQPFRAARATPRPRCRQGGRLRFKVHQNNGRVIRVALYIGRRRIRTVRGRRITHVTLRAPRRADFSVRIVAFTAKHKRVASVRRYRHCTKGRPHTVVSHRGRRRRPSHRPRGR